MRPFVVYSLILILLFGCKQAGKQAQLLHFSPGTSKQFTPVEFRFDGTQYQLWYSVSDSAGGSKLECTESMDLLNWTASVSSVELAGLKSIATDWNNSLNLEGDVNPELAFCVDPMESDSGATIRILLSQDGGKIWSPFETTPVVLPDIFNPIADLKVFWNETIQSWNMLVLSGYDVLVYTSADLQNWEYQSRFGDEVYLKTGNWSSFDFFPMQTDGSKTQKWVMYISSDAGSPNEGSGVQYFVGDFDGYVFQSSHNKPKWLDHGSDLFDATVLSDYRMNGKPAVQVATIRNSIYSRMNLTLSEKLEMTIPRSLKLSEHYHDYYLLAEPVILQNDSLEEASPLKPQELEGELILGDEFDLPIEIDLVFDVNNRLYLDMAESFGIQLKSEEGDELVIGYQAGRRYFYVVDPLIQKQFPEGWDGFYYNPFIPEQADLKVRVIVDRNSTEIFAADGMISLTKNYSFKSKNVEVVLFASNGKVSLTGGRVDRLNN